MHHILVTFSITPEQHSLFEQAAPGSEIKTIPASEITQQDVLWADIILGNPPVSFLHQNNHLGLLALNSAGSTDFCEPGVLPEHTILTNATGAYGIIISEWMTGMLLYIYNHFASYRKQQMKNCWKKLSLGRPSVYGSRILIVGAGNIGTEFAKRVKAMGAYTIGIRRTNLQPESCFDELHLIDDLDSLLPNADVIALSLPGTLQTTHLINEERLSLFKQGAVLLNVGRGSAVDSDALYHHLASGHLMAAGLDVTEPEPLPENHPLWKLSNAYITPHISGGMDSPIARRIIFKICLNNLRAYLGKGDYQNIVDRQTGYRKH